MQACGLSACLAPLRALVLLCLYVLTHLLCSHCEAHDVTGWSLKHSVSVFSFHTYEAWRVQVISQAFLLSEHKASLHQSTRVYVIE